MNKDESDLGGHADLARVVGTAPATLGGLAVMVWLSGPFGRYAPAGPLTWLALAGLCLTPPGERIVVWVAYGFRQPTAAQLASICDAAAIAQSRTGITSDVLDVYVRRGVAERSAYSAGRRSIEPPRNVRRPGLLAQPVGLSRFLAA